MKFQEYREAKRISPAQAASQLGVEFSTIWRWETGKHVPTPTQQLKIQDWSDGAVRTEDWKRAEKE